jgi:uncharacterized protein YbaP (TraB family)
MKNILVLLSIFISSLTFAQKNDHSLLWEISGNGLKSPSYLYGTMHVSNKIAFHLGDSFYIALDQAEKVCLESDPSEWIEHMYGSKSKRQHNYVNNSSKNFYENIVDIAPPEKKSMEYALRKNHALENGFLYRGSSYNDEYEENTYLDLFIFQYAKKNKKQVIELEDYDETNILQVKAMFPDEGEDEDKKQKGYSSSWNKELTIGEAMEEAYRNGNIEIIDSITRITAQSDNYLKYFLHERNRIMTIGIDTLAKKHSIFIGIGAAHLPGENGVINMLRELGYKMRPVQRTITQFAKDKKNSIEEKFIERPYKPFTTNDGYLTVSIPGKLYETPGDEGELQYFFPDMSNGGNFFISRFQTYAPLRKSNAVKWEAKIDSIIFENIEGKIINQKKVKVNGFNAIDILNKSRKGEFQRRLIVFTPLEVIFFKMSGTGDWAKIYGDRFIKSIKINTNNSKNQTYTSHLGEYTINFPSQPLSTVHAHKITESPLSYAIQSFSPEDSSYFLIQHDWMNDFGYIEEDSFEVAYLVEIFLDQFDSVQTTLIEHVNSKKAKGYAVLLKGDTVYFNSVLRNNFYFLLTAKSNKKKAEKFFNSFKYTGNFKEEEFQTYHDTLLRYTVNTSVLPNEMEDWYKVLADKRDGKIEDWDYVRKNRSYFNKKNYESIYVNFLKHSDYYYMSSLDSLWKDEFAPYTKSDLKTIKFNFNNNDTLPTAHYWFGDTNSNKVIEIKKYLNKGIVYTVKSAYDSTETRSKFISEFFKTFAPDRDTLLGRVAFKPNATLFFTDLASGDTTKVKRAVELINRIEFKKNDVDSIIWHIDNYEFPDEDKEESVVYLIKELGYLKHPSIISYLSNKYQTAMDDYKVQIACLKSLAKQANKQSFKEIKKLIIQDAPITPNARPINQFFRYLDDSLLLTSKLYPDAWDLLLYTDYRSSLYSLSSMLLDSNLINPKSYKREQPLILREAKETTTKKKSYSTGADHISLTDYYTYYSFGKPIKYKVNTIDQYDLTSYLKLLMPYYKSNPKVKTYLHSLLTHNTEKFRFIATVILTKHNLEIHDSLYTNLSKSPDYRFAFYKALQFIGKESKFDSNYLDQESLMESAIYASSSISVEDSVKFIKKVLIKNKADEGYVYFFKHQSTYNDKWYIHYAGIQPIDTAQLETKTQRKYIQKKAATAYTEDEINKEVKNLVKELRLIGRSRAAKRNNRH